MEKADVFITVGRDATIKRFIRQLFGYPHGSPLPSEMGMAFAFLAAKQSVSLGRSVGAVILSRNGDIVSLGWNEVGDPGRGVSRESALRGARDLGDHVRGHDASDEGRILALLDFFRVLGNHEVPEADRGNPRAEQLRDELFSNLKSAGQSLASLERSHVRFLYESDEIAATRLLNLIEFGRPVHAEMAAVTDAARRGIATQDMHMVVTTFPCHECARNIVAAGIASVTYLQPYDKSMAGELYDDMIDFQTAPVDPADWGSLSGDPRKVIFAPFEGIAPHRFDELFSRMTRKTSLREAAWAEQMPEGQSIVWPIEETRHVLRDSIRGYISQDVDWHFEVARQLAEQSVSEELVKRYEEYIFRES